MKILCERDLDLGFLVEVFFLADFLAPNFIFARGGPLFLDAAALGANFRAVSRGVLRVVFFAGIVILLDVF